MRQPTSVAQELLLYSSEMHSTNDAQVNLARRPNVLGTGDALVVNNYKAIVYLHMIGGLDSLSMLVPYADCGAHSDLFEKFSAIRDGIPQKASFDPINATGSNQMCSTFGLSTALPVMKELYERGEGLFVSGLGTLLEPITKDDWTYKTASPPRNLGAHNWQTIASQAVHTNEKYHRTHGVLGRMIDALSRQGLETNSYSTDGYMHILRGNQRAKMLNPDARLELLRKDALQDYLTNMTSRQMSSIFGETIISSIENAVTDSVQLGVSAVVQFKPLLLLDCLENP